jgi:hypothetical protein
MKTIRKPPTTPTATCTTLGIWNWLNTKQIRNINGNSTIPCPTAINAPENLLFAAFFIVTANKGPGIRTPESEISRTEAKNK